MTTRRDFLKLLGIGAAAAPMAASVRAEAVPEPKPPFPNGPHAKCADPACQLCHERAHTEALARYERTFVNHRIEVNPPRMVPLTDEQRAELLETFRNEPMPLIECEPRDILRRTVTVRAHLLTAGHAIQGVEFTRAVLREIMENTRLPVPVDHDYKSLRFRSYPDTEPNADGWVTALHLEDDGHRLLATVELNETAARRIDSAAVDQFCVPAVLFERAPSSEVPGPARMLSAAITSSPLLDGLLPLRFPSRDPVLVTLLSGEVIDLRTCPGHALLGASYAMDVDKDMAWRGLADRTFLTALAAGQPVNRDAERAYLIGVAERRLADIAGTARTRRLGS